MHMGLVSILKREKSDCINRPIDQLKQELSPASTCGTFKKINKTLTFRNCVYRMDIIDTANERFNLRKPHILNDWPMVNDHLDAKERWIYSAYNFISGQPHK